MELDYCRHSLCALPLGIGDTAWRSNPFVIQATPPSRAVAHHGIQREKASVFHFKTQELCLLNSELTCPESERIAGLFLLKIWELYTKLDRATNSAFS